jgi:hypothetical protein
MTMVHRGLRRGAAVFLLAIGVAAVGGRLFAASHDDLSRRASWQVPVLEETRAKLFGWLDSRTDDEPALEILRQRWSQTEQLRPDQVLQLLVESLSEVNSGVKELMDLCQRPRPAHELPGVTVVDDPDLPAWIRANLKLFYGEWLANEQLFDETAQQLADLQPNEVVDPGALLFYQSVAAHRRLEKDRCLSTLGKLLEHQESLPQRYVMVARLMQSDLEPLRPDSLDEVSRLMDNIKIRLGHGRAGKRVRTEEKDVVDKLDKMIEQLEQQASAAAAAGAAGGANAPSTPMEDSMPGGGSGPGNVDPKQLGTRTDWGNLPPKQREEALQQLSKDLPSHYRDVIEEYFRKLARDQKQP